MVIAYLAVAMLVAIRVAALGGAWRRSSVQWALIALLVIDFFDAPIPLTTLDRPLVYQQLAGMEPGAVCEVPFGVGDGLTGTGSQDRSTLYYATLHGHPVVGGYVSRMPVQAAAYESMPLTRMLLHLSNGENPTASGPPDAASTPCRYLVVRRAALSEPLRQYLLSLPMQLMVADGDRDLYRLELKAR